VRSSWTPPPRCPQAHSDRFQRSEGIGERRSFPHSAPPLGRRLACVAIHFHRPGSRRHVRAHSGGAQLEGPVVLGTIAKAARVLDLFTKERADWGISEVAEAMGVPRSSAHRLLSSLADTGLLRSYRGRYWVGWRVLALSQTRQSHEELESQAAEPVRLLVDRLGETVHLAILQGSQVLCVKRVVGHQILSVAGPRAEDRIGLRGSAIGKALLAQKTPSEARQLIPTEGHEREETPLTPRTGSYHKQNTQGDLLPAYALDDEGTMDGVCCVAAPIADESGIVFAAVGVAVPKVRFSGRRDEIVSAVIAAAQEITNRIGA
jgi:DNA-binding IclR family transcriptional regulator